MPPVFTQLRISADYRPVSRNESLTQWIFGLAFAGLIAASLVQQFVPQKLSIVFFVVFWFAMLALHELGHALMAKAVGWRVSEIVIGFGPQIWRGRVGETRVRLHIIPVEGYVLPAPVSRRFVRLKTAAVYAAGPGIELLLLALLVAAFGWQTVFNHSNDVGLIALKTLAIAIVWGAGFNLLPFTTQGGVSDGLGIILSPFMTDESVELRMTALELREVDRLEDKSQFEEALALVATLRERYPDNRDLHLRQARLLAAAGQHEAARAAANALRGGRPIVEIDDVALLHTQALVEMAQPKPDTMTLDLALSRALQRAPEEPTLSITRGAALILRGRDEEGGNLIAQAFIGAKSVYDRARALGYLAVAAHRCRQPESVRRFYEAFAHINRSRTLREWVDGNLTDPEQT